MWLWTEDKTEVDAEALVGASAHENKESNLHWLLWVFMSLYALFMSTLN